MGRLPLALLLAVGVGWDRVCVSLAFPFPLSCAVAWRLVSPGFTPALTVPARFLCDGVVLDEELEAPVAVVGGAEGGGIAVRARASCSRMRAWRISSRTITRRNASNRSKVSGVNGYASSPSYAGTASVMSFKRSCVRGQQWLWRGGTTHPNVVQLSQPLCSLQVRPVARWHPS